MSTLHQNPADTAPRGYGQLIRRRGFACLIAAQALGVFNDNSYKTILSLYVISRAASAANRAWILSACGALFVVPYILFSSYAGQVADRLSKRRVIVLMKMVECCLMTFGTVAMYSGHIPAMLVVLFLMGTHSTFLSPAKEGILPELVDDEDLSRANGLLQLTIYTMIVFGAVAAGLLLSRFPTRPYIPVSILVVVALIGLALSQGITRVPASGYKGKFRWNLVNEFWRNFGEIRANRALLLTVLGIAYFWFLGAVYLLNVMVYGRDLLHLGDDEISFLNASISIGIGLGAAETRLVLTAVPDTEKGEKLIVLHTELGMEVEELLRRLRETQLPRLWIPRKEGFYRIDALPVLGTGKLDLKRIKDTAKRLVTAVPASPML